MSGRVSIYHRNKALTKIPGLMGRGFFYACAGNPGIHAGEDYLAHKKTSLPMAREGMFQNKSMTVLIIAVAISFGLMTLNRLR